MSCVYITLDFVEGLIFKKELNYSIIPTEKANKGILLRRGVNKIYDLNYGFHFNQYSNSKSIKNIDLSDYDTSSIEDMRAMFNRCSSLSTLDLSNFDTSKVYDMFFMFKDCWSLQKLDLSNFDTTRLKYTCGMFHNCRNLKELDLSSFDIRKVENFYGMFFGCDNLKRIRCTKEFKEICFKNQLAIGFPKNFINSENFIWETNC